MDEEEEKEKKRKREKDIKSQKKPSVPKPGIPEKKDGVLKPGNSAPGIQASGPTCLKQVLIGVLSVQKYHHNFSLPLSPENLSDTTPSINVLLRLT